MTSATLPFAPALDQPGSRMSRHTSDRIQESTERGDKVASAVEAGLVQMRTAARRMTVTSGALAAVLVGATAFLIYAWRAQHPAGLMSVDDSQYAMLAVLDWRALVEHGLGGLLGALTANDPNGPVVPLLTAPLTANNPMTTATVLVEIPFMWLLIISADSIFRRVSGPKAALVGTVVTAFLPGVLSYARLLHFAVPLTAVLTAALAALLASRRLTSWKWALAFGVLTGLAPLTRTVGVSMVPGLVLAAVVVSARQAPVHVWVRNLMLALVAAAVVAGPWYLTNFSAVFGRLVSLGYDGSSSFYIPTVPWVMRVAQIVGLDILLPLTILGLAVVITAVVQRRRPPSIDELAPAGATAVGATAAVVVAVGWYFIALSSSHTAGTAFTLPIAPLLVALVLSIGRRLGRRPAAIAGATALALVVLNITAAVVPFGRVGVGDIAGVGDLGIVDGRSASDAQISQALGAPNATISDPASFGAALRQANCAIAARAEDGAILMTRPDALLGGILYCAEAVYRTQPFMYATGCASADSECIAGVVRKFGFPTIITGRALSPYAGAIPEDLILLDLAGYHIIMEIDIAPGEVVHVWAPTEPQSPPSVAPNP